MVVGKSKAKKKIKVKEPQASYSDKTVYKALGLSGGIFGAAPCAIDVKNDRIVRIRPLHYDAKYDRKSFNPSRSNVQGSSFSFQPRL